MYIDEFTFDEIESDIRKHSRQINNISSDIQLDFKNTNVTRTLSTKVDDSIIKQDYLGGYIEIQPDSFDGSATATDSSTKTWGFPMSLTNSEQKKIKERLLHGNVTNIRYIRFPLGFAYRGFRNIDGTSGLAKNIGERWTGQNSALKLWFEDIAEAGGGLAPEYWCPSPHWITSGSYSGENELTAGGSYARTITLSSIKISDATQYNTQITAFANAIVDDLEYLHQNIAPVRMFGLQNEPGYNHQVYGACKYDAQTYNDVLEILYPKIQGSAILKAYNGDINEVKLLVASSDEWEPFSGIANTFITNHPEYIWGYTHHSMRKASGENTSYTGADWYKTSDFASIKTTKSNVFINEYEYFNTEFGTDDFRCSNSMLHLINESVYGGAKVLHPVIHICKPTGQTLSSTNTKGYCLYESNLKGSFGVSETDILNKYCLSKGTSLPNVAMFNQWALFGDNLPVGAYLVGDYSDQITNGGWCAYKYGGKLYLFIANNSSEDMSIKLTFNSSKVFNGKAYNINYCGDKIKSKIGQTIEFVVPAYSGQCWIENTPNAIIINSTNLLYEYGGISPTTGAEEVSDIKIRTNFIELGNSLYVNTSFQLSTMQHIVRWFDANKNYISSSTSLQHSSTYAIPNNAKYARLVIVKTNIYTVITPIELEGYIIDIDSNKLKLTYIENI